MVSFIAGWAILLDYTILIAVTAFSATNYLAVFHREFGSGSQELVLSLAIVGYVVVRNIRGFSRDAREPDHRAGAGGHRAAGRPDRRSA